MCDQRHDNSAALVQQYRADLQIGNGCAADPESAVDVATLVSLQSKIALAPQGPELVLPGAVA
jgi:hypothetical protein